MTLIIFYFIVSYFIISGQMYSYIIMRQLYKRNINDCYYAFKFNWLIIGIDIYIKFYAGLFPFFAAEYYLLAMDIVSILSVFAIYILLSIMLPYELKNRDIKKSSIPRQNHLLVAISLIASNIAYIYFCIKWIRLFFFKGIIFDFSYNPLFISLISFWLSSICIWTGYVATNLIRYNRIKNFSDRASHEKFNNSPIVMLRSFVLDYHTINSFSFDEYISKDVDFQNNPIVAQGNRIKID